MRSGTNTNCQLRAVAQVEVLGEGVVLPAARVVDGGAPPDARGAVEVEEAPAAVPAAVLEDEMTVEQNGLNPREQRVVFVDVAPAGLDHRDLLVAEVRHQPREEIGRRQEVGVEDGDELASRDLEAGFERAGFEAAAIRAVVVLDVDALRCEAPDGELGDAAGLVRRVVEHLDLEQLARVLDTADSVDEPVGHVHLVVQR
jgi:hypothetical protein